MTCISFRLGPIISRLAGISAIKNNSLLLQTRQSSYESSKFAVDVGEVTTKYQVTKDPEEWKYVERVLPITYVPEPTPKSDYPSGWKPAANDLQDRPYCVERTKNHMMPVYLKTKQRGVVRHTVIRKIKGDIWLFKAEITGFLQDLIKPKPLRIQVDEFSGKICINGDHVNAIKYWLSERNY